MKRIRTLIIHTTLMIMLITSSMFMCHATEKEYEYDDSGRVTKVIYEDGSYETYEYDKNGNIIQIAYTQAGVDSSESSTGTDKEESATEGKEESGDNTSIQPTPDSDNTGDANHSQGTEGLGSGVEGENSSGTGVTNDGAGNEGDNVTDNVGNTTDNVSTNTTDNVGANTTDNGNADTTSSTGDTAGMRLAFVAMVVMMFGIYTLLRMRAREES